MRSIRTFKELLYKLDQLVGVPFSELKGLSGHEWRGKGVHNKGWGGNLIDKLVGDEARNEPEPDISFLGIEVKSITIGENAKVIHPTKITSLNYATVHSQEWWESTAFHKTRAVLFVPIVKKDPNSPDDWFIRRPFIWLPSAKVINQFKGDYDSVRTLIKDKRFDEISSARPPKGQGLYLHPKPGADNSKVRSHYRIEGKVYSLPPKVWMLRTSFTQPIVTENLRVDLKLFGQGLGRTYSQGTAPLNREPKG